MSEERDTSHLPAPSLWPIGFAIGVACVLVGLVVSVPALIVGAIVTLVFGFLWVRDLLVAHPVTAAQPGEPLAAVATEADVDTEVDRATFLSVATIGVGALIGAAVTVPVLGFGVLPSFMGEGVETKDVDLGPISNFPEGTFVIATYLEDPAQGEVSRRTAFIRNNGRVDGGVPSFTAIFSRCVHLGCPVQPNGPIDEASKKDVNGVELRPVLAASFGCPCHGGLYDSEGNRSAGPPVRSLDRYEFSIKDGNLILGRLFSVGNVEGTGAKARIMKYYKAYPGVHVDGVERWLYPIPTPGSTG
ncbi:MAG TPA: ubiquinol-cytochrome c reductase iron-sulfur subunit [Actinomycetota bacterium]|nr:ubiquinol-cytochrome c reductase iron-sulfur subunit [Actinomycetota bacterium]